MPVLLDSYCYATVHLRITPLISRLYLYASGNAMPRALASLYLNEYPSKFGRISAGTAIYFALYFYDVLEWYGPSRERILRLIIERRWKAMITYSRIMNKHKFLVAQWTICNWRDRRATPDLVDIFNVHYLYIHRSALGSLCHHLAATY